MTFTGYCTNKELCTFLDFGYYNEKNYVYNSSDTEYLDINSESKAQLYLIYGMHSMFVNGIAYTDYSINLDSGEISFTGDEDPEENSEIKVIYWLNVGLDNNSVSDLVIDGASELEQDVSRIFRTISVTDYTIDVNPTYDYIKPYTSYMYDGSVVKYSNYKNKDSVLELAYGPIQSVASLTVNGTSVTPSTLKLEGNKIMLTEDSEVQYFSREADSVVISFSYGITETILDQTEFEKTILRSVKRANILKSSFLLFDSPQGENLLYENSFLVSASDGRVRADVDIERMKLSYEKRYNNIINKLKIQTVSTI
jgi:hypothetical protein